MLYRFVGRKKRKRKKTTLLPNQTSFFICHLFVRVPGSTSPLEAALNTPSQTFAHCPCNVPFFSLFLFSALDSWADFLITGWQESFGPDLPETLVPDFPPQSPTPLILLLQTVHGNYLAWISTRSSMNSCTGCAFIALLQISLSTLP